MRTLSRHNPSESTSTTERIDLGLFNYCGVSSQSSFLFIEQFSALAVVQWSSTDRLVSLGKTLATDILL
jgi:hypothetical protein